MKNGRINKRFALLAILCLLVMVFAVPVASAASYSKVYGQTQDKIRVRESASTNATIIDNIVKDACVYITTSKVSGSNTFVQIKYRASDGSTETGWVCQSDSKNTYVKVLSADQTKTKFKVSGGDLPSKAVGTFTAAERKASAANSDNTYIRQNASGETVKRIQTELKALKYYSGKVSGNAGEKTVAAIKSFQSKNGLTADGIAGPQTIAKIDAAYEAKFGSYSASSANGLKLDSKGTDVRNLQQDLTTLGYYWAEITGSFGAKTETAVKRFQEENGLTPDGVAGTKTLNAIASAIARKGGTSASSSSAGTTLKLNSQGTKVSQLQTDLSQLGYYYAEITGHFGNQTETAVKAFQKAKGLSADGVAGTKTLNAVAAALGNSSSSGSSTSSSVLRLGSTGNAVSTLQQNLTTLGYYYGDITGHYGNLTEKAVKNFQKAKGLTQDGLVSTSTQNAIASALKNAGIDTGTITGTVTALREGDKGTAVTELQTMLKKLEYYYGDVTGSFGSLTKQAVRKFQAANNLTVDGIAGSSTLNKLRSLTGTSGSNTTTSGGATVTTDKSYGKITKDNVYLRASYSTLSERKASLPEGKLVRITKTYTVSGVMWYYITVNIGSYTYKGYVRSDMMTMISESEYNKDGGDSNNSAGDQETIGMIRVTGNNVSLRYEPSTDAKRVGTANSGDCFYYVDTTDGWFQTKAGYWISSDYAKVMSDSEVNDYNKNNGSSDDSGSTYTLGSTGTTVSYIQNALTSLGYYDKIVTGHYGKYTKEAVRDFQRDYGLTADGVCGPVTLAEIQKAFAGSSSATTTYNDTIYDLNNWFNEKARMSELGLKKGGRCKLTDLRTGKSLNIYIQSAGNHADVEPLTAADTTTLCEIYGASTAKKIGWEARPMMITVGNYQFICSIYGEPHGVNTITDNNFDGQFCLHFTGSKTHGTGQTLQRHVNAIKEATTILQNMKKNVVKGTP